MLKANEVFPDFHLKYGALTQKSDDLISSAIRDFVDLALYGMTQAEIDETKTIRNEFADMPTDAELIGDKIGKTEAKAEKSKESPPELTIHRFAPFWFWFLLDEWIDNTNKTKTKTEQTYDDRDRNP